MSSGKVLASLKVWEARQWAALFNLLNKGQKFSGKTLTQKQRLNLLQKLAKVLKLKPPLLFAGLALAAKTNNIGTRMIRWMEDRALHMSASKLKREATRMAEFIISACADYARGVAPKVRGTVVTAHAAKRPTAIALSRIASAHHSLLSILFILIPQLSPLTISIASTAVAAVVTRFSKVVMKSNSSTLPPFEAYADARGAERWLSLARRQQEARARLEAEARAASEAEAEKARKLAGWREVRRDQLLPPRAEAAGRLSPVLPTVENVYIPGWHLVVAALIFFCALTLFRLGSRQAYARSRARMRLNGSRFVQERTTSKRDRALGSRKVHKVVTDVAAATAAVSSTPSSSIDKSSKAPLPRLNRVRSSDAHRLMQLSGEAEEWLANVPPDGAPDNPPLLAEALQSDVLDEAIQSGNGLPMKTANAWTSLLGAESGMSTDDERVMMALSGELSNSLVPGTKKALCAALLDKQRILVECVAEFERQLAEKDDQLAQSQAEKAEALARAAVELASVHAVLNKGQNPATPTETSVNNDVVHAVLNGELARLEAEKEYAERRASWALATAADTVEELARANLDSPLLGVSRKDDVISPSTLGPGPKGKVTSRIVRGDALPLSGLDGE